jgi:hypothetical protein
MVNTSLLLTLVFAWVAVTAAFTFVMIWKAVVSPKAEDVVILDPAEDVQAADQERQIKRVQRLGSWAKRFGFSSLALLLAAGGVWVYQAVRSLNAPTP